MIKEILDTRIRWVSEYALVEWRTDVLMGTAKQCPPHDGWVYKDNSVSLFSVCYQCLLQYLESYVCTSLVFCASVSFLCFVWHLLADPLSKKTGGILCMCPLMMALWSWSSKWEVVWLKDAGDDRAWREMHVLREECEGYCRVVGLRVSGGECKRWIKTFKEALKGECEC